MTSPGNSEQEIYAAAIIPTAEIIDSITIFKDGLSAVAGSFPGAQAEPVILLFAAVGSAEKIREIADKTETLCRNTLPFSIHLENFGEFHKHKTLFVDIQDNSKDAITRLRKHLSAGLKSSRYDEELDFSVGKTPHITIARNLADDQYRMAKNYFHNRKYSHFFECSSIAWRKLQRRGNTAYYTTEKTFPFAGKNLSLF